MLNGDLITKYRPQTFDEVVGQEQAVRSLRDVIKRKSSRAFILVGPSGTGKTTLARIVAMQVGCKAGNLIEVNASNATGVDDMRAVLENMDFNPLGGGARVYILDEAQALSRSAWNSLLKPVEEPPTGVWFFFCTTEAVKIPATIKTRCTAYDLKPVHKDAVFGVLQDVAGKEGFATSEEVLYLIAEKAQGSVRQALSSLAQCHRCKDRKEAADLLRAASEESDVIELARALARGGLTWQKAMVLITPFKDEPAEGIRLTIVGYLTTTLLHCKDDAMIARGLSILSAFSTPYYQGATVSALILSLGEVLYGE